MTESKKTVSEFKPAHSYAPTPNLASVLAHDAAGQFYRNFLMRYYNLQPNDAGNEIAVGAALKRYESAVLEARRRWEFVEPLPTDANIPGIRND